MILFAAFDVFPYEYENLIGVFDTREKAEYACTIGSHSGQLILKDTPGRTSYTYNEIKEIEVNKYYELGVRDI